MSFIKTVSANITVDGTTYNSLDDLGLAISNTDYIGTPQQSSDNLIAVPGRNGYLDLTETVFGGQYFSHRSIDVEFGGIQDPADWDAKVSEWRNLFEGKIVKVEFSTLPNWYFKGRAEIQSFEHKRALGTFTFSIPKADPFMYQDNTTRVMIFVAGAVQYVSFPISAGISIPSFEADMAFTVQKLVGSQYKSYSMPAGVSTNPQILLESPTTQLRFTSSTAGNIYVSYTDQKL